MQCRRSICTETVALRVWVHADGVRNPESLSKRVFMRRREVSEEILIKYFNHENPHIVGGEESHRVDHNPLHALALQHRHRSSLEKYMRASGTSRSITGLPMLNPSGRPMIFWSVLMLLVDGIYTALFVPVEAAFDLPHEIGSTTGTLDFIVGVLLCVDVFLRFHVPIELTSSFMTYRLQQVHLQLLTPWLVEHPCVHPMFPIFLTKDRVLVNFGPSCVLGVFTKEHVQVPHLSP
jgi:hypothetical protein